MDASEINKVYNGISEEKLKKWPDNFFDSCCTDPPFFLLTGNGVGGFMNKEWDGIGNYEERILWKSKEFAQYVVRFFSLLRVELPMEWVKHAHENANTSKRDESIQEKNINVQYVKKKSKDISLNKNISSVRWLVLTREEVLDLLKEMFQSLTIAKESLLENALFAIPISFTQLLNKNAVQKNVVPLLMEEVQEAKITHLTLMDEVRIRSAIEGMIGMKLENQFIKEMNGDAEFAKNIVGENKFNAIISIHIKNQKIIHWITSLLFVTFATKNTKENQKSFLTYQFHKNWLHETFRVLKPGAHLLICCGTRTQHSLGTAIEDAGFEIRDVLTHNFASGFPKSMDISKAIDREAGADRKVVGKREHPTLKDKSKVNRQSDQQFNGDNNIADEWNLTEPSTDAAKQWNGFGTGIKPATEFWTLARKPISEKTVAANVLKWGVGAINIDGCRIEFKNDADKDSATFGTGVDITGGNFAGGNGKVTDKKNIEANSKGRFPANVIFSHHENCICLGNKKIKANGTSREFHDGYDGKNNTGFLKGISHPGNQHGDENGMEEVEDWQCVDGCPVKILNEQSGELTSGMKYEPSKGWGDGIVYSSGGMIHAPTYGDTGGAARFFYQAKPSSSEKDKGLENFFWKRENKHLIRITKEVYDLLPDRERTQGNIHPTVKSVDLCRYLVRLITPKRGITIDPFCGSGTTLIAAKMELINYVGIDMVKDHCDISEARVAAWKPPKYIEQTLF